MCVTESIAFEHDEIYRNHSGHVFTGVEGGSSTLRLMIECCMLTKEFRKMYAAFVK